MKLIGQEIKLGKEDKDLIQTVFGEQPASLKALEFEQWIDSRLDRIARGEAHAPELMVNILIQVVREIFPDIQTGGQAALH